MNGCATSLPRLLVPLLLWTPAAFAADIGADSAIESVLVFPESADVTRLGEISIPAGDHRVIVTGLPQSLNPDSVRVRFGDEAIIVGAVEASAAFPPGGGPEQAQALRDRLQDIQDQIQTVDDRIATGELQLQFLQSQASAPKAESGAGVDPDDWGAALRAIETGAQQARQSILEARQSRRALERAAEEAQLLLDAFDDDLALRTDIAIALTATEAVTTGLSLQYQVEEAGWAALYEARLDSEAASLALDRKIRVFQNSGEDWSGVRLAVSTAPPTDELSAPFVDSRPLTLADPLPPAPASAAQSRLEGFASAGEAFDAEEISVSGSRLRGIATVDASFASTYSVGGLVDVLSDGLPRSFTIGQEDLDVDVVIRTAPRLSLAAFVTAKLTFEGGGPLPAGALRLYRDGAYLREDYLETLIPGDEVEIGFGVDQAVVVSWIDEGGRTSETGLIGRSTEIREDHRFEALNRHDRAFTVEIVDWRPISQDDDVTVRVGADSTPPDEDAFDDEPGVLAWRRVLEPDEALGVRNAYTVVHPSNRVLVGR